jgi:hypothetical protein
MVILCSFISVFETLNTLHDQGMHALRGPVIAGVALMILQEWRKGKEIEIKKSNEMNKARRAAKGLEEKEGSRIRQSKLSEVALPALPDVPKKTTVIYNEETDKDLISRLERLDKELCEIRGKLMSRSATEKCENEVISIDESSLVEKSKKEIDGAVITPNAMVNSVHSKDVKLTLMQSMFLFYKKLDSLTVSDLWGSLKEFACYLSRLQFSDILDTGSSMLISLYSFDYLGYFSISVMQVMGRSKVGIEGSKEENTIAITTTHNHIPIQIDPSPSLISQPVTVSDCTSVMNTEKEKEKEYLTSESFKNEVPSAQENESEYINTIKNMNDNVNENNGNGADSRPQSDTDTCTQNKKEDGQEKGEEGDGEERYHLV